MKNIIHLVIVLAITPFLSHGQTPKQIHDLKTITDSTGNVHLLYRIFETYSGTEYYKNNIYHLDTFNMIDSLLLEDYFDLRFGSPYKKSIKEIEFFGNGIEKFIYTSDQCYEDCEGFIVRSDVGSTFEGAYLFGFRDLNLSSDKKNIYVNIDGRTIVNKDSGLTWPTPLQIDTSNGNEDFIFDFPLKEISPINDSLMFGVTSFNDGAGRKTYFVRSVDRGNSTEIIEDSLLTSIPLLFDINGSDIYLIDEVNCGISENTCTYEFYRSNARGRSSTWVKLDTFRSNPNLTISKTNTGKLYLTQNDSILVSNNYGESFDLFKIIPEKIRDIESENNKVFVSTESKIYETNGTYLKILKEIEIPISNINEYSDNPAGFKLNQNYPNPFNPVTTITYRMRTAGVVTIELYTIQGQRVKKLVNDFKTEGQHSFRLNGSDLASGIYILRGKMGVQTETRKITLIK